MTTASVVRPKIPQELRLRVFQEIVENPEISSREIINNLIKEDPGNIIFFYSNLVPDTFTLNEMVAITNCNSKSEKKELVNKLKRKKNGEYSVNLGVITRIKNSLNRKIAPSSPHGAIYGASNLGYVVAKDMNASRAARWLYPRIAQIQHECLAWHAAGKLLGNSGSPERKKAAENARKYINKAMVYKDVKMVADGIRNRYIRNEKK